MEKLNRVAIESAKFRAWENFRHLVKLAQVVSGRVNHTSIAGAAGSRDEAAVTPQELAEKAAAAADRFSAMVSQVDGVTLDYTRESIDRLSALLSANREDWLASMDATQQHRFTELMGCYYGECVRRLLEGSWVWMGEHAAVQVAGVAGQVHFALPFSNVDSHFHRGNDKKLAMLHGAFEALVRGEAR